MFVLVIEQECDAYYKVSEYRAVGVGEKISWSLHR